MSRKKRYIENLTQEEITSLEAGKKDGKSAIFRDRCHGILLSHKGFSVEEIQSIFSVARSTIYNWFNRWDSGKMEELKTKPGQGRKPTLSVDNATHVETVKKACEKRAKEGANLLATIEKELEMDNQLSMRILRPFLKKLISYGNASVRG